MKNRTIIGIICIALSVAVMFGLSPLVNKLSAEKIDVYQLNKIVAKGDKITEKDIEKVEIGGFGVKSGYITKKENIVGKYPKSDIYPNVNVYPSMLNSQADSADDVLNNLDGKVAISITIPTFATGLSGKLENGDIVSIIVSENMHSVIPNELKYVRVVTTTTAKGTDANVVTENEDGTIELPTSITLLVNERQAELLAEYESRTKMHVVLVYRGDEKTANRYLAGQEKVFGDNNE